MKNLLQTVVLASILVSAHSGLAQTYTFDDETLTDTSGATTLQPYNLFGSGQIPAPAAGSLSVADGSLKLEATHFGMGTSSDPALLGTILGPTRIGAFNPVPYSDFRVSIDIVDQGEGGSSHGLPFYLLGARITNPGPGTTSGYAAQFGPAGRPGIVLILKLESERTTALADEGGLRFVEIPDWSAEKEYRMVFTGRGAVLTVRVYELSDLITPLFSWSVTDSTYPAGITGVVVSAATFESSSVAEQPIAGVVDNFVSGRAPERLEVPALSIQQAVRLSWPVPEGSFRLESSHQISGPWKPVSEAPVELDGAVRVTVIVGKSHRFFRLQPASE